MLFLVVIRYLYEVAYTFLKFALKTVVIIAVICSFELLSSYSMLWYSKLLKTSTVSWDFRYFTH